MSKQRDQILHILNTAGNHMTAEEIFLESKLRNMSISIATIYRNLGILLNQNKLRKISIPGESDRYDSTLEKHDHMICDKCKSIRDIYLGDVVSQIEDKVGDSILSYDLNITYICPECRERKENKNG